MKIIPVILFTLIAGILAISCEKEKTLTPVASLAIINAAQGSGDLAINFTTSPLPFYKHNHLFPFGSSYLYSRPSGEQTITMVSSGDTTKPYLVKDLSLESGKMYSMYLLGNGADNMIFQQETAIPSVTEGKAGYRLVNLSQDIGPVSIHVAGNPESLFSGVNYKQFTGFQEIATDPNIGMHDLEVRNEAGTVVATFTWYYTINKPQTIVVGGSAANGLLVFQVNNY